MLKGHRATLSPSSLQWLSPVEFALKVLSHTLPRLDCSGRSLSVHEPGRIGASEDGSDNMLAA